jgi:hypothetical protein
MDVDITVDRHKLDEQLEAIPGDVLSWSRQAAMQVEALQRAENNLKLVEARLSIAIRQNPLNYGFAKVTEDLVKAIILTEPEYVEALDHVAEARAELTATRGVVDALEIKRSSLKYLAELTVAGYLGSMSVNPRNPSGVKS